MKSPIRGSLPEIIGNDDGLYEGDLTHYFRHVFYHATNLRLPYHNFWHMTHVLTTCHSASRYYRDRLTGRKIRNLLVAALFHDFDHRGILSDDDLNIERAIRGLDGCLLTEDEHHRDDIVTIIRATEYPHKDSVSESTLSEMIIRDADVLQVFSPAWIQQIIFGLGAEQKESAIGMLRLQVPYLEGLELYTEWAKEAYPQKVIDEKLVEVRSVLAMLEPPIGTSETVTDSVDTIVVGAEYVHEHGLRYRVESVDVHDVTGYEDGNVPELFVIYTQLEAGSYPFGKRWVRSQSDFCAHFRKVT
jgi:hypothetical protein